LNSSGDYKDSIHHATLALKIDPNSVKALYLRSIAYSKLKSFDEAS
jgi:Flp pilus assembly protein TadD